MERKRNLKIQRLKNTLDISLTTSNRLSDKEIERRKNLEQYNIFHDKDYESIYQENAILGEGCVGQVKKVIRISDGKEFASKMVSTIDEEKTNQIIEEFMNCRILDHPNIVKVYELYIQTKKGKIYTVMEFINAKQMFSVIHKINSYNESIASKIFQQILSAIKYLHEKDICHRDLKPNNILATEDGQTVKITDFNISKFGENKKKRLFDQEDNIKMWTYTGTVAFTAPEVFTGEYNENVDMWSAGVVLYVMLSGQQPFDDEYVKQLVKKIQTQPLNFQGKIWETISDDAKDIISALLQKKPENRLTPGKALLHPFITHKQNTSPLQIIAMHNLKSNLSKFLTRFSALQELGVIRPLQKRNTFGIFRDEKGFRNSQQKIILNMAGSNNNLNNITSLKSLSEEDSESNLDRMSALKKPKESIIYQLENDNTNLFNSPDKKKKSNSVILDDRYIVANEKNIIKLLQLQKKICQKKEGKEKQKVQKIMGQFGDQTPNLKSNNSSNDGSQILKIKKFSFDESPNIRQKSKTIQDEDEYASFKNIFQFKYRPITTREEDFTNSSSSEESEGLSENEDDENYNEEEFQKKDFEEQNYTTQNNNTLLIHSYKIRDNNGKQSNQLKQ